MLIAQLNGDYEAGAKLQTILGQPDGTATEDDFDSRMDRALDLMPLPS